MFRRITTIGATALAVLMIAGLANAAGGINAASIDAGAIAAQLDESFTGTYDVAGGGSVTIEIDEAGLHLIDASPAPGWNPEVRSDAPTRVEVRFTKIEGDVLFTAKFEARLEGGEAKLEIKLEQEPLAGTSTSVPDDSSTTTSMPDDSTTTTSMPDDSTTTTSMPDDSTTTTSMPDDSTTTTVAAGPVEFVATELALGPAGSAQLEVGTDGTVRVVSVDAPGWSFEIDKSRDFKFEIELWNGDVKVEVEVRFSFAMGDAGPELGITKLEIKIDDDDHDDDDSTTTTTVPDDDDDDDDSTTTTTVPDDDDDDDDSTTTTTLPDDDDDDDHGGDDDDSDDDSSTTTTTVPGTGDPNV